MHTIQLKSKWIWIDGIHCNGLASAWYGYYVREKWNHYKVIDNLTIRTDTISSTTQTTLFALLLFPNNGHCTIHGKNGIEAKAYYVRLEIIVIFISAAIGSWLYCRLIGAYTVAIATVYYYYTYGLLSENQCKFRSINILTPKIVNYLLLRSFIRPFKYK